MKVSLPAQLAIFSMVLFALPCNAQDEDAIVGYRRPITGVYALLYKDSIGHPKRTDYVVLDHGLFIKRVGHDSTGTSIIFYLVTIPGPLCLGQKLGVTGNPAKNSRTRFCEECQEVRQHEAGREANRCDYQSLFWISKQDWEQMEPEHILFSNSYMLGIVTLPWVYRFKRGEVQPILDGGFSISAALGWRIRVSNRKNLFVVPVAAPGFRTVNYTAANNTAIKGDTTESGSVLTFAGGLLFEMDKKQIGILAGWDTGLGDRSKNYIYDGAPWVCFTIGISLFTIKADAQGPLNK